MASEAIEEDRHEEEDDRDPRSIIRQSRKKNNNQDNELRLHAARSRSSARSHHSHLADGYGHHNFDDEDQDNHNEPKEKHDTTEKDPFEVRFDGEDDVYNPKNLPEAKKWFIVFIVAASSLCVTCASAMYTSTYRQLESEFHVSRLVATVGLTTYVCGYVSVTTIKSTGLLLMMEETD